MQKHDSSALPKQNYTIDMFRNLIFVKSKRPVNSSRFRPDDAENVLDLLLTLLKSTQDVRSTIN